MHNIVYMARNGHTHGWYLRLLHGNRQWVRRVVICVDHSMYIESNFVASPRHNLLIFRCTRIRSTEDTLRRHSIVCAFLKLMGMQANSTIPLGNRSWNSEFTILHPRERGDDTVNESQIHPGTGIDQPTTCSTRISDAPWIGSK